MVEEAGLQQRAVDEPPRLCASLTAFVLYNTVPRKEAASLTVSCMAASLRTVKHMNYDSYNNNNNNNT